VQGPRIFPILRAGEAICTAGGRFLLDFIIAYLDLARVDAVNVLKAGLGSTERVLRFTTDINGPELGFLRHLQDDIGFSPPVSPEMDLGGYRVLFSDVFCFLGGFKTHP